MIPSMICCTGLSRANFISFEVISTARGKPVTLCRPRTIARSSSDLGSTVPTSIFKSSAVSGPISNFFFRFIYCSNASSKVSLPMRKLSLTTTPESQITAISVVPPPISTTIAPTCSALSKPVPIAAANGSSMRTILRAPACNNTSKTARFSTGVILDGTQAMMRERMIPDTGTTRRIK